MKTNLPPLSNGLRYGSGPDGKRVCLGACMGRSNTLPPTPKTDAPKLRLVRLKWVDGDYDEGGAYWGNTRGTWIYRAVAVLPVDAQKWFGHVEIFVRATGRTHAKIFVREIVPNATFFN